MASFLFTFPDRPHRRERLAELFWPDLDAARARRALNSAVWRLRRLMLVEPESVGSQILKTVGSETILERASWLDIDAWAIREVADVTLRQPSTLHDPVILNGIKTTLHRYEGPFLDGDEGDWILEERERLHSLFLKTTITVVHQLGAARCYDDAISLARHALRFDPYREELVRILLVLLALDERRCEAIRYYDSWCGSLKAELGVMPLPKTQTLLDDIRALQNLDNSHVLRSGLRQL